MSAYHTQKTQYKDKDCLIAALKEQGYGTVEDHEIAQHLVGYHSDVRPEKANIIVRRQYISSAANDLGFVKEENGTYSAIVSSYDSGKHNSEWYLGLKRAYVERVDIKTAQKQGFKYLGKKIVAGKVQLQFLDTRA